MSRLKAPPEFEMPSDFMRSFTPKTGVGNREELVIENIRQIPVYESGNLSQYRYRRFNNTDYVLGKSTHHVVINIVKDFQEQHFGFNADDAILNFSTDYSTAVKDVTTFTRFVKNLEYFYVAILTENQKTSLINTYEIVGNKAVLVAVIDIGMSLSTGASVAIKVSHVQSQFGGSLVVLIKSTDVSQIIYRRHGSSELNHYIEVHFPYAMDLETFLIHGSGYVAVCSHNVVEVYKMDQFAQTHLLFDRLSFAMGTVTDLGYFRLGFTHYLVVAADTEQSLYSWTPAEFSLKQIFPLTAVKQVYAAVLSTCRDDVLLLFIGDKIDLYIYSGVGENFVPAQSGFPPSFTAQPGSATSFAYKSKVVLVFSDMRSNMLAFIVETSFKEIEDPILSAGEEMTKIMKDIKARIDSQAEQVKTIKEVLANAVRSKGDQVITAFQTFDNVVVSDSIEISEVVEPTVVEWEGSNLTMEEYKKGTERLEKEIEDLEQLITEIERIIPDVVRVDQPSVVTGRKIFAGDIRGPSIVAVSLNLDSAAGVNLKEIQKDLYRLDKPNQIKGILSFEQPLTVLGNLDVEGTVNGIDISEDVMTTNTKQTSTADMTFLNKVIINGNLDIEGKLNGIDIGKEVVTLHGNHRITGTKSFLNGIIADQIDTKLLDGIDLDYLKANAFTVSGNQTVPGLKTFTGGVVANDITLLGKLNGFDVTELANSVVRVDQPAVITGHKTFSDDVIIDGDLNVMGKINGLKLPEDLFLTDVSQVVSGPKSFLGTVTAYDVSVSGKVDGLSIPDDIVTLSKDETISSTLYFMDGISVEKNIIVENLVDGVDISEVAKEALKINETNQFKDAVFFGPVTINGDLDVGGLVNKVNLQETVRDIVYKDEYPIVIKSEKYFQQVAADSVKVQSFINGFNIEKDFMRVHGDQIINGTKIFKKPVIFNTVFIENDAISGINIKRLYEDQIALAFPDKIDNDVEFTDSVVVEGDLIVHGTVNGLKIPEDVVLRNSRHSQIIENKVFQKYVKVDNLIVDGDMEVSGTFGNIDLRQFYRDRITLSGDQEIDGDISLGNSKASKVWISGLVNGINFLEFSNNVMSKTKDQVVTAQKIFSGRTMVNGPITTQNGVNGVNLAELKQRAFKLHEDNVVTAQLEFSDISIGNLMVSEFINGVNLTHLYHDSLKKYDSDIQYVTGITSFDAGFHVDGDIMADTVNDMVLTRDVLLKSVPQDITGQFTLGSVGIGGNLEVEGLINGMDLSEIAPQLARTDEEYVIESNITFARPIKVLQNVEVSGLVNGVNLKELFDNVLLKSGDQFIPGSKTFRGNITIRGDLDVETVNGVPWKEFVEDIVVIDKPQRIQAPKTFTDVEVRGDIFVAESAQVGTINGQDLSTFINDVVFTDVPANITGPIVFKEAVEIAGNMDAILINGLRLKTDVVTIECNDEGPQVIKGQKTFHNLASYGDIIVENVNSYDLQELYFDTLLIDGNQNVTGRKKLMGEVVFQADVHPTTVNGIVLRNELVTLNTDQEIAGPLTFEDDVFIKNDINIGGLLNGIDLKQLEKEAVYLDREQVIDGSYTIQNAIAHSDVAVQGTVNGLDLVALDRNITDFWNHAAQSIAEMEKHSEDSCELANYLQEHLKKTYLVLDGFVTHQKIESSASFLHVTSPKEISLIYIEGSNVPAYTVKSTWDASAKAFIPSSTQATSIARTISLSDDKVKIEVHIGVNSKDSFVSLNGATDRLPGGFKESSVLKKDDEAIIALLFPSRGVCDTYKITGLSASYLNPVVENYGSIKVGKEATFITMFEISGAIYMAVSSLHLPPYRKAFSQIYARANENWSRLQSIGAASSPFVKHFLFHNYHYLAFINNAPVYETREPKSIQVYRNAGPNEMLFTLFQKVPFDDAKGIEIFQFGDLADLYLTAWNETVIKVFRLEGEAGMRKSITLYGRCIQDVKPLLINNEIYLAVGQQNLKTNEIMPSVIFKGILKGSLYVQHNFTYC
ncbi:uncharacterized protein LOC129220104 [Uloborus diversus]|uniref:uncharacterized protein LOC129220104 n=1 Tax=Uloborus diversus TaxID=327109 RepID=UPI00240A98AD|nr:uncharacterized protein LOC129220104 [Uloborus diversus]